MEMKMQYWWDISEKDLTGHVSKFHLKKWDFLGGGAGKAILPCILHSQNILKPLANPQR